MFRSCLILKKKKKVLYKVSFVCWKDWREYLEMFGQDLYKKVHVPVQERYWEVWTTLRGVPSFFKLAKLLNYA